MGLTERHGVRGRLWLQRDWTESSSTHLEHYDDYYLEASSDEGTVLLVHAHGKVNFIRSGASDYREDRVSIPVRELIELVREQGVKV